MDCVSFVACVVMSAPSRGREEKEKGERRCGQGRGGRRGKEEGVLEGAMGWARCDYKQKILQCIEIYNIIVRISGQIPHHT
jgi:hypothetical protein